MENEKPSKRHSLLPQRSASGFSNHAIENEESSKLAPPASTRARDVSPSKLPVGGSRKAPSGRQTGPVSKPAAAAAAVAAAAPSRGTKSRPAGHRPQSSSVNLPRGGGGVAASGPCATAAPVGRTTPSATQTPANRRTVVPAKATASTVTPGRQGTRSETTAKLSQSATHRASASISEKDLRSTAGNVSVRTLANVKVQRPAAAAVQKPSSPKKPLKPPVPVANKFSLLSGPAAPALKPVHDLKLELLHLHMLHRSSHQTKAQWTASARAYYEKIFNRLVMLEDELRTGEMEFLEQRNASALIAWCRETGATGESKTKVLSGVLDKMWLLVAPGGRYTASVAAFEDWYAIMERSHDLRSLGVERQHVDIMEGLGDGWKMEADGIMSSLCVMSDALEGLGPAVEPSDLARCLNVLMTLLANMLDELMLIRDIEQKLTEREGSWVRGRIEGLSARISGEA